MYKGLTGRSVSPIIVAVLHDVVRAAVAVLVTSPASTRAVRLPAHGAAWSWGDCGRTPQTESYRTSPLSSWRCSCRRPERGGQDPHSRCCRRACGRRSTDQGPGLCEAQSESEIFQIFAAIKDGVLQIPPVVRGGQVGDVRGAVAATLEQEPW